MSQSELDGVFDTLRTELEELNRTVWSCRKISPDDKTAVVTILEQILSAMDALRQVEISDPETAGMLLVKHIGDVRAMRAAIEEGTLGPDTSNRFAPS